jgi:hypothetical protein
MADIKISDATPAGTLLETDLVPIARSGSNLPYNATMADLATYITVLATTHPPQMSDKAATAGTMEQYARADHVHPTDTSRAPIDSPQFKGSPTAPTMAPSDASDAIATTKFVHDLGQSGTLRTQTPGIDDNSELVATTEFVQNQGSSQPPLMDGVPTAGVSQRFSRGDHTHPTDTSRAAVTAIPVASTTAPIMDGSAAVGTGTTWARSDHVHPVDTSRYAASNPAGYQTQAQVRAGTTTNDNAAAGQVGEFLSAILLQASAVALTTGVDAVVAQLTLTAGDWDVWGSVTFQMTNGNAVTLRAWINQAASQPSLDQLGGNAIMPVANNVPLASLPITPVRVAAAAGVSVTLGATAAYGGTITAFGKIMARRRR